MSNNRTIPKTHIFTAIAAIMGAAFAITEAIAKMTIGPRPSLDDETALVNYMSASSTHILLVVLADTFLMAALVVFFVGLRFLIKRVSDKPEWVSDVGFGAILVYAALTLVGDSMDGGTALDTTLSHGNPIVIRTLIESHILLFGPIGSVFIALGVASFGYALLSSRLMPSWIAFSAYVVAAVNAIAIIMVFRSIGSVAYGTEVTLVALVLFIAWVLVTGLVLLQENRRRVIAQVRA